MAEAQLDAGTLAQPSRGGSRLGEPSRLIALGILGALSSVFLAFGLIQAGRDAPTVDEAVDLAAGLVALEAQDLRMNPEHGLLHHVAPAVLPSIVADPIVPRTESFRDGDWFDYTEDLISANDEAGRLDQVLFWFRVVPLLAGAATGLLLYVLCSRLLGRGAGLVAAGLWLTTPYIVGLAHLSSLDVSFACAVIGLAVLADRYRSNPTDARLVALALGLGLALLVRHSAAALAPVVVALVVVGRWRSASRQKVRGAALVLLLPILVVWVAHRSIDLSPVEGPPRERFEALISTASSEGLVEELTLAVPMPLEWKAGFAYLVVTSDDRPAYLFGQRWDGARAFFFPGSAVVKLPLTVTVMLVLGAFGWARERSALRARAMLTAGALGVMLAGFLLVQPLNLGLRLAIPVLALLVVLGAGVVRLPKFLAIAVLVAVGAGQAMAFLASHPNSLAWTPPPFSDGYRFVSDSSVDFGQANRDVRTAHEDDPFVAAQLLAPRGYQVLTEVPTVISQNPSELVGRVAVSATMLNVLLSEDLSWLRAYCPVDVIGGAVLVYQFEEPPVLESGPAMPAAPCDGEVSRRF